MDPLDGPAVTLDRVVPMAASLVIRCADVPDHPGPLASRSVTRAIDAKLHAKGLGFPWRRQRFWIVNRT